MSSPKIKVLFASYCCMADRSSEAAVSARVMLEMLAEKKLSVRAFCGPLLVSPHESPSQVIADLGLTYEKKSHHNERISFEVWHIKEDFGSGSIFVPEAESKLNDQSRKLFVDLYDRLLDQWQPDVLVTYGEPWGEQVAQAARRRGIPVVFLLYHSAIPSQDILEATDVFLAPSRSAASYFRRKTGLECATIAPAVRSSSVFCETEREPQFITCVNPQGSEDICAFGHIAAELARRKPGIPLLVASGRDTTSLLDRCELDLTELKLRVMDNIADPREYYRESKIVLVPSVREELFGRIPIGAMINGIPMLASTSGALPERLRGIGFLFPIPGGTVTKSSQATDASFVTPWIETIVRLWEDNSLYSECAERCLRAAEDYREDKIAQQYADFFHYVIRHK